MLTWLKTAVGRKLLALFITPLLLAALSFINQFFPPNGLFTPEQMTEIINKVLDALMILIGIQGVADTVNGSPGRPKPAKPVVCDPAPTSANILPNAGLPSTEQ